MKGNVPHVHGDGWDSPPKFYNHKPSEAGAGGLNCFCQQGPLCNTQHFISHGTAAHRQGTRREGFWNGLAEKCSTCEMASSGCIWGEVMAKERI